MSSSQQPPLDNLEQIVTDLVIELLLLHREKRYPDQLFGNPDREDCVRLSAHYVMALRAYGFEPHEDELRLHIPWFDTRFPQEEFDIIDTREMNRLLVTLRLNPKSSYVNSRLRQLARQMSDGFFDIQPGWPEFDTLWTMEAFVRAFVASVLPDDIITDIEIERHLNRLITGSGFFRDKDKSLALRLYYEMFSELKTEHKEQVDNVLEMATRYGGLWGTREFQWRLESMPWYDLMAEGTLLTHADIAQHEVQFRKVFLSNCMVIENLAPLREAHAPIGAVVDNAMHTLWTQINQKDPITTLRHLFPRQQPRAYITVLCRLIRAIGEYVDEPLRDKGTLHLLRELTKRKENTTEDTDVRNIKEALRNWIDIDLQSGVERLKLGFSEADVVRVRPYIQSPLLDTTDERPESLIRHSLVVKYGPHLDIERERKNYNDLPDALKDMVVRFPPTAFRDSERGLSFVIMQDLRGYRTLYEVYNQVAKHVDEVTRRLCEFLHDMHGADTREKSKRVTPLKFRDLYLNKMIEYVDRIFAFLETCPHLITEDEAATMQHSLFEAISDILRNQEIMAAFPTVYMHGDLHLRNIMVSGLSGDIDVNNLNLKFKLIDLEFMRQDGDAAFDAGQLLVDIELTIDTETTTDIKDNLKKFHDKIMLAYELYSHKRDDPTFTLRLKLAKARALLRICKGMTKRGSSFQKQNQQNQSDRIGFDVIQHTQAALVYLAEVATAVNNSANGQPGTTTNGTQATSDQRDKPHPNPTED